MVGGVGLALHGISCGLGIPLLLSVGFYFSALSTLSNRILRFTETEIPSKTHAMLICDMIGGTGKLQCSSAMPFALRH